METNFLLYIERRASIRLYNSLVNSGFPETKVKSLCKNAKEMIAFINETKNFGIKSAEELYGLYLRFYFGLT